MNLYIYCSAGRRGAGAIDCITCGTPIHQRPQPGGATTSDRWYDGYGSEVAVASKAGRRVKHKHAPAPEIGPTLGPFEYVDVTYDSIRVEGEVLAYFDPKRGDWILTDEASAEHAGQAYSDLTISGGRDTFSPSD